jgi:hypothetical protein
VTPPGRTAEMFHVLKAACPQRRAPPRRAEGRAPEGHCRGRYGGTGQAPRPHRLLVVPASTAIVAHPCAYPEKLVAWGTENGLCDFPSWWFPGETSRVGTVRALRAWVFFAGNTGNSGNVTNRTLKTLCFSWPGLLPAPPPRLVTLVTEIGQMQRAQVLATRTWHIGSGRVRAILAPHSVTVMSGGRVP